ncbi:MAG: hypothetical protein KatS3mg060_2474 [Dehalococcoidia bacterium]|nr:MAG: hypothetical protein KatS3mg060_2474 [Dehalococcoidia bacterium]
MVVVQPRHPTLLNTLLVCGVWIATLAEHLIERDRAPCGDCSEDGRRAADGEAKSPATVPELVILVAEAPPEPQDRTLSIARQPA